MICHFNYHVVWKEWKENFAFQPFFSLLRLVSLLVLLTSCSGPKTVVPPAPPDSTTHIETPAHSNQVVVLLNDFYSRWRGTPYQLGGFSQRAVDCSGLTKIAYQELFHIDIPRTTWDQARVGMDISRNQILPGDLLFFNTGYGKRHVGIYVEDNLFIHASTSRGVMKSDLNNSYWRSAYKKAVRILY